MSDKSRYNLRGVSASKSEVHKAIKDLDKGLFPLAFCKVLPDFAGGDEAWCNLMHADTAGTKTSLAYLYWKETGDLNVWKGIAQDAIVMNVDDMGCVGAVNNILLSSTIGRNKHLITGDVIAAIIEGAVEFIEKMAEYGVDIYMAGGETADVGDIVRTIDVGYTTFTRMKRRDLIVNDIQAGDVVIGLASYGQTTYETEYNSGIGSNGLTSARHDVLSSDYRQFTASYADGTPIDLVYSGSRKLTEELTFDESRYTVGKLLLSPTRTYLPVIAALLQEGFKEKIHGIIHNTGGAHSKVNKFVRNKRVIKDNLLPVPPVFQLIREESGTDYQEMFQVFNMGTRLEIYTAEENAAAMLDIIRGFGIEADVIGRVEEADGESVDLHYGGEAFTYA